MIDGIDEAELVELEQRAARVLAAAPTPWIAWLETRHAIGGESFIQLGDDPASDQELYIKLYTGSNTVTSPDADLDAVIDFVAHAAAAIPRLIAEVRRLRRH
ncbi:MAG TPA: hypothetical protein VGH53_15060 [Streptosporangiaceae bacterium]|jgi:hypothetical protein